MKNVIEKLVVLSDGNETVATYYGMNGKKLSEGKAVRSPKDKNNFSEAAKVAISRALPKFYNVEYSIKHQEEVQLNKKIFEAISLAQDARHKFLEHYYFIFADGKKRVLITDKEGKVINKMRVLNRPINNITYKDFFQAVSDYNILADASMYPVMQAEEQDEKTKEEVFNKNKDEILKLLVDS